MAWYLNRALTTMRAEVDTRWPHRDKGSDGTIGDAAHAARASDHNPDGDGSVDAWDMDVQLNGVGRPYAADLAFVIGRFMRHPAAQYVIYNRRIASRNNGWTWETYGGTNPHDKHVHFNTRSAYEDSTAPWGIEEDDVTPEEFRDADIWTNEWPEDKASNEYIALNTFQRRVTRDLTAVKGTVAAVSAAVAQLAGRDFTDEAAIAATVLAGLDPAAIAAAIPADLAQRVADELATRLQD